MIVPGPLTESVPVTRGLVLMAFRIALIVYAGVFLLTLHVLNAPGSPLTLACVGLLSLLTLVTLAPYWLPDTEPGA